MRIVQFLPNLSYGDAISNFALELQNIFLDWGHESEIFVKEVCLKVAGKAEDYRKYVFNDSDLLIFHASISSEVLEFFKNLKSERKVIIYHNASPCEYFEMYNDKMFELLKNSKSDIASLKDSSDLALAVSEFNRKELIDMEFANTDVLPIILDFSKFENLFNFDSSKSNSSVTQILFVGRFAPNKCHADLIKAFYMYRKYFDLEAKLYLVGNYEGMEKYFKQLQALISHLNLSENVIMPGHVSFKELIDFYRSSNLFLSMSEHEGFFVPLLESFYFELPVLAFDSSAVSETMGGAGVLFKEKKYFDVAVKMNEVLENEKYRESIVLGQKKRLKNFDNRDLERSLKRILSKYL